MRRIALAATALLWPVTGQAQPRAPLYDSTYLNIGLGCQWQQKCIAKQQKAMKSALKYVKKYQPPTWRIHLCNRNASRKGFRVDWIGFDNCIRNADLRMPPPRPLKKTPRRITQTEDRPARGERG